MMVLKVGSFTLPPIGLPWCAGPRMQPELCASEPTIFFLSPCDCPFYARHVTRVGLWEPDMKPSHGIVFPSIPDPVYGER